MERRESTREELNAVVQISLNDRNFKCNLINLSEIGALLKIDAKKENDVSDEDLGEEAKFIIRQSPSAAREYTGEIIRLFYRDDEKYIALRFWEKYKELD